MPRRPLRKSEEPAVPPMRTSYRDIFLLACCQALLLVNNAALIAMNGLVGYALAPSKSLATVGVTSFVLGSAVAAMPASLWMARVGRRRGFMTGSLLAIVQPATQTLVPALVPREDLPNALALSSAGNSSTRRAKSYANSGSIMERNRSAAG